MSWSPKYFMGPNHKSHLLFKYSFDSASHSNAMSLSKFPKHLVSKSWLLFHTRDSFLSQLEYNFTLKVTRKYTPEGHQEASSHWTTWNVCVHVYTFIYSKTVVLKVIPVETISESSGNLQEMQNLKPLPRPVKSEALGLDPAPIGQWALPVQFENHCPKIYLPVSPWGEEILLEGS